MPDNTEYSPEGHHENQLIEALEPDQLVTAVATPLPLLQLSLFGKILLWAVRVFVLVITVLVIYTFVVKLLALPGEQS